MLDELIKLAEEVYKKDKALGKKMGDLLIKLHKELVEQNKMMANMSKDMETLLDYVDVLKNKKEQ
jgi:hypothetical protein